MAVLDLYLCLTHIRASKYLERKRKDLVPLRVPLLPMLVGRDYSFRSESIYTDSDRSIVMDQRWLQWVKKLLPGLKAGKSG